MIRVIDIVKKLIKNLISWKKLIRDKQKKKKKKMINHKSINRLLFIRYIIKNRIYRNIIIHKK